MGVFYLILDAWMESVYVDYELFDFIFCSRPYDKDIIKYIFGAIDANCIYFKSKPALLVAKSRGWYLSTL
jgi:hypothetical protein